MNKAILMGRLTRDPEMRQTQSGRSVTSFTLAVNRSYVRQGEERQADFINIVAWGKTAEFCSSYFRKGQQVAVVGRIQTRTWDDNNGQKRYATEVVADEVFFADSKRDNSSGGSDFNWTPPTDTQSGNASFGNGGAAAPASGSSAQPSYDNGGDAAGTGNTADTAGFYELPAEDEIPF